MDYSETEGSTPAEIEEIPSAAMVKYTALRIAEEIYRDLDIASMVCTVELGPCSYHISANLQPVSASFQHKEIRLTVLRYMTQSKKPFGRSSLVLKF